MTFPPQDGERATKASLLAYALAYAKRKFRILPLHSVVQGQCSCGRAECSSAGKHPRTKNGVKDATLDARTLERWWQLWPDANIGIATGDGILVVDVDLAKGADLSCLAGLGLDVLQRSLTVITGSGGRHYYVLCEEPLPNSANKLGDFIDTRGEGGYVVAPPSYNAHGRYLWKTRGQMEPIPPQMLAKPKDPKKASIVLLFNNTQEERDNNSVQHLHQLQERFLQNGEPSLAAKIADCTPPQDPSSAPPPLVEARNVFLTHIAGVLVNYNLNPREILILE